MNRRFLSVMIWADAQVLTHLLRPVWALSRWTGWDSFRLARAMVIASPIMLMIWYTLRYGSGDMLTVLASCLWIAACWGKLREFDREERVLRRNWANGEIIFPVGTAVLRVLLLDMFLTLDVTRHLFDLATGVSWWEQVVLAIAGFHCTIYALALYVHVIPPGPPPQRREKRDWLAWLRPKLEPVAT